jgi:hypothetical protein
LNFLVTAIHSQTFRKAVYICLAYVVSLWISNKFFDGNWKYTCMKPVTNLDEVYKIPEEYDNFPKINLKMLNHNLLGIEGNRKFKVLGNNDEYGYYDSVGVTGPDTEFSYTNKIYLNFQNSNTNDSFYFVISHSSDSGIFWNQIFYSSLKIHSINNFSYNPDKFRLNSAKLVNPDLLNDNNTLINQVKNYFNTNLNSLGLAECGTNSRILKSICSKYNVPCNIIVLQGGDSYEAGFDNMAGYPIHVVCEIYSSEYSKWYVLDPSYGTVFRQDGIPLSAAEISNSVFFRKENRIIQDSVLATRKLNLGEEYFQYYNNIYYSSVNIPNIFTRQLIKYFYKKYDYMYLHYSNKITVKRNGNLYIGKKTLMYLIITVIYLCLVSVIFAKRLYELKKKINI